MDFDLPEDIVAFRDAVRKFAAEQIRPYARDWTANSTSPTISSPGWASRGCSAC